MEISRFFALPLDIHGSGVYNIKGFENEFHFQFNNCNYCGGINMSYNTRQRELILDYIKKNAKKHLTADDIADALKAEQVGKTTVYRYLEKLCEQNIVRKFILSEGKSACYQYNDEKQCHDHFHMKCLKCGKLFHLECDHLKDIAAHISKMHDFTIDSSRTVFYGICGECAKKTPTAKEKSDI